ncbi:hypothetical protein MY8738_002026 [Beauveria namnaoensis]
MCPNNEAISSNYLVLAKLFSVLAAVALSSLVYLFTHRPRDAKLMRETLSSDYQYFKLRAQ